MKQSPSSNIRAWLLIVGFLILIVVISCLLLSLSTNEDRPVVLFALLGVILAVIFLFYLWRPRGNMGALLVRVPTNSIIFWQGIMTCVILTLSIIALALIIPFGNTSRPILNSSFILGEALVILSQLSILVRRIEIRENGINGYFGFVAWKDVESYRWHAQDRDILLVKVKGRKLVNPKRFPIYNVDKVGVNKILQERLPLK